MGLYLGAHILLFMPLNIMEGPGGERVDGGNILITLILTKLVRMTMFLQNIWLQNFTLN